MKPRLMPTLIPALLGALLSFTLQPMASAQVAGSSVVSLSVTEMTDITKGWSAKKSILGKTVFTEKGERIGRVDDLIVAPNKSVSYLIIGAGGFIGIGRHDVAIAMTQIEEKNGRLIMPGASKDALKSMPSFEYAIDTTQRDRLIANTEDNIAQAKLKLAEFEKKASVAQGNAKTTLDQQRLALQKDINSAEETLAEMGRAGEKHWQEFESEVSVAAHRLRRWVHSATR